MTDNRPQGRKRVGNGNSASVHKRGDGLGTGPVGNSSRPQSGGRGGGGVTRGIGGLGIIGLIAMFLLNGGGGILGGGSSSSDGGNINPTPVVTPAPQQQSSSHSNGYSFGTPQSHTTYTQAATQTVDTTVASSARDKYTTIKGNGKDEVTILIYMCGADLESRYGMATADLTEMANATMSDKVNIIIETGGAKKWRVSAIEAGKLQRWKIGKGSIEALDKNVGKGSMTDEKNLEDFIKWGVKEYPANRYELIFWDHGGGSVSGYGQDELYPNGSMSIDEISSALKNTGVKFDFIGFDACLMATYETAVAMEPYADYLIASEEAEPGTGWYYTDWLTTLAENTSTPTVEVGKEIVDTFISASLKQQSSASVTLSVTDLAELKGNVTKAFKDFSSELSSTVSSESYKSVADARSCTKEFAAQMSIDQIDLINFCDNLNTAKSNALAKALRSAVKYNKTKNINNSYGISIYFPYRNTRMVNSVVKIYNNISFDSKYSDAVRSFGTMAASGNVYNNSTQNSLFNVLNGGSVSNGNSYSSNDLFGLLNSLTGGSSSSSSGGYSTWGSAANSAQGGSSAGSSYGIDLGSLLGGNSSSIDQAAISLISSLLTGGRATVAAEDLVLSEVDGQQVLRLDESDWENVHDVALNVWIDDGDGYIDLGLDNIYTFNEYGDLVMDYDRMWLALDGQPVSYYATAYEWTDDSNYIIEGYIPAYLNDELVRILVRWTAEDPDGSILGAQLITENGTLGKGYAPIEDGDVIDLVCDYYSYGGEFEDTYFLGEQIVVDGELTLEDVNIENNHYSYCYRLTDTLGNTRWTPAVAK